MQLIAYKIFEGNQPPTGYYTAHMEPDFVRKHALGFWCKEESDPIIVSANRNLDGFRKPELIAILLDKEAATFLGFSKQGFYKTDLPADCF